MNKGVRDRGNEVVRYKGAGRVGQTGLHAEQESLWTEGQKKGRRTKTKDGGGGRELEKQAKTVERRRRRRKREEGEQF